MGKKDPLMFVRYTVDEERRLQHLFWCDGKNDSSLSEVLENMRALNRMYDLETETSLIEEKIRVKMERVQK